MWNVLRWLGIAAGIASLSVLAWKGFEFALGDFLIAVLEYYEGEVGRLFALLEPLINRQLSHLREWFGWNLQLYPHWKHAFILLWLYFGACARGYWQTGKAGSAAFVALWGGLVALVAGAASGTVALGNARGSMFIALWPIAGVIVFELGYNAWVATFDRDRRDTWLADFGALTGFTLTRIALPGLLALVVGALIPQVRALPNPGLSLLFALTVVLAAFWVWQGSRDKVRLLDDANSRIGFDMLTVIGGACVVVLLGMMGL